MPGYVPPLDRERRELLDPRRNPFFTHGYACYWIARRDGAAVGRISAQVDELAPRAGEVGLFGALDATDDAEVVRELLHAAEAWHRERGRRTLQGPYLLSINGEPGMLVEGHDQPPMVLLPWHPKYLDAHVRAAGYERAMGFVCMRLDPKNATPEKRLPGTGGKKLGAELTVRNMDFKELERDAEIGRRLYNDAWQFNWGFTPVTEPEMRSLLHNFRPFLYRDSGFFVEFKGEPVAVVLVVPNLYEIVADLGPAPSPLGWAKFAYRVWRRRYRTFRFAVLGVASKYRESILGARIAAATLEESRRRVRAHSFEELVAGWIVETNSPMLNVLRSIGFQPSRLYNVYERRLPG